MSRPTIGLQLYTLRDEMNVDLEQTLRKVAALGFRGVEFAGYYGWEAHTLRKLLDELGLQAIGSHVGYELLRDDLQGQIDYMKTIGGQYVICPYLQEDVRHDEQAWKDTFAFLQQVGQEVVKQGLSFCYHNHAFEFESKVEGAFAFDAMYTNTDSLAVKVELDVCWVQFAGQDPLAYIRKYAGRLPLLHLKDFTVAENGDIVTLELGTGKVDLPAVLRASEEAGVEWLIVEQDMCQKPPLTSIGCSMEWLKENF